MSQIRFVRDPRTGRMVAVPADQLLTRAVNPGMGASSQPTGRVSASAAMLDMYSRLPDADLAGARGPGVVPGGEQGKGARRGQAEQEGQPPPPGTYRPLGGARANNRGGSITLNVGDPSFSTGRTFNSIVETPKNAGDDAESIIVTLGRIFVTEPDDTILADVNWKATAILTWGVGGASFEAEIDWMQGTTLVLPASYARVSLRITSSSSGQEFNIIFAASLSYGTPTSGRFAAPARLTETVVSEAGNIGVLGVSGGGDSGSTLMLIPAFANSFNVQSATDDPAVPNPNIGISFTGFPAAFSGTQVQRYVNNTNLAGQGEQWFPIPNGATLIRLENLSLAEETRATQVIFNLAL